MDYLEYFLLAFIPLFVAIDPIGLVPVYLSLSKGIPFERRNSLAYLAATTAFIVGTGFMLLGRFIFAALHITVADFQIAGGVILFAVAARDILFGSEKEAYAGEDLAVVPLGIPLIAGPAMLTALLALTETAGLVMTLVALSANLLLVVIALRYAHQLRRWIPVRAMQAVPKIIALLLAAIAVNLIRRGWQTA